MFTQNNLTFWVAVFFLVLLVPYYSLAQVNPDSIGTSYIEVILGGPTPVVGDLWVSPKGSDTNSGTGGSPLLTISAAIEKVKPGQTIWITEGTYKFTETLSVPRSKKGTADLPFRIAGIPGAARPKLDFTGVDHSSEIRGIQLDGSYWHLRYLEIFGVADNGINVNGSGNLLEWIALHDNGDTGLQINSTNSLMPAFNRVLNCDSYMNADNSAEDADGFAAKLVIGPGNSFEGCRAWYNCDDNWDLYDAQNIVTFKNCWSIAAKHPIKSKPNSDGNGFKLGGIRSQTSSWNKYGKFSTYAEYVEANTTPHKLENCFAFGNPSMGFTRNNNPTTEISCTNCGAWSNGKGGFAAEIKLLGETLSLPTVTPAMAIAAERDSIGYLPDIRSLIAGNKSLLPASTEVFSICKVAEGFLISYLPANEPTEKLILSIYRFDGKLIAYQKFFENEFTWIPEHNTATGLFLFCLSHQGNPASVMTKKVLIRQ
jgi:hypothetical protein